MLKDKLGFDDAFNYKEESDLKSALKRLVYFYFALSIKNCLVLLIFSPFHIFSPSQMKSCSQKLSPMPSIGLSFP